MKRALLLTLGLCLLVIGCGPDREKIQVSVSVDFGPAGREQLQKSVAVPAKSTVFDALRVAFSVATSGR